MDNAYAEQSLLNCKVNHYMSYKQHYKHKTVLNLDIFARLFHFFIPIIMIPGHDLLRKFRLVWPFFQVC